MIPNIFFVKKIFENFFATTGKLRGNENFASGPTLF